MHRELTVIGIGKFTIADEAIVDEADLGVNFFLDEESLGQSRAERCVKLLQELNPDVKGDWYPKVKVVNQVHILPAHMLTECVCRMASCINSLKERKKRNIH